MEEATASYVSGIDEEEAASTYRFDGVYCSRISGDRDVFAKIPSWGVSSQVVIQKSEFVAFYEKLDRGNRIQCDFGVSFCQIHRPAKA